MPADGKTELQSVAIATFGASRVAELLGIDAERLDQAHCNIAPDGWEKLSAAASSLGMHELADRFASAGEPGYSNNG